MHTKSSERTKLLENLVVCYDALSWRENRTLQVIFTRFFTYVGRKELFNIDDCPSPGFCRAFALPANGNNAFKQKLLVNLYIIRSQLHILQPLWYIVSPETGYSEDLQYLGRAPSRISTTTSFKNVTTLLKQIH